jgi:hypothetical protein
VEYLGRPIVVFNNIEITAHKSVFASSSTPITARITVDRETADHSKDTSELNRTINIKRTIKTTSTTL